MDREGWAKSRNGLHTPEDHRTWTACVALAYAKDLLHLECHGHKGRHENDFVKQASQIHNRVTYSNFKDESEGHFLSSSGRGFLERNSPGDPWSGLVANKTQNMPRSPDRGHPSCTVCSKSTGIRKRGNRIRGRGAGVAHVPGCRRTAGPAASMEVAAQSPVVSWTVTADRVRNWLPSGSRSP
jgi:hypothetical protein